MYGYVYRSGLLEFVNTGMDVRICVYVRASRFVNTVVHIWICVLCFLNLSTKVL